MRLIIESSCHDGHHRAALQACILRMDAQRAMEIEQPPGSLPSQLLTLPVQVLEGLKSGIDATDDVRLLVRLSLCADQVCARTVLWGMHLIT